MFTDTFGREIKRAGVKSILNALEELTNLTCSSGDNYSFVGTDAGVSLTRLCENDTDLYSLAQSGQENIQVDGKDRELIAELFVLAYRKAVEDLAAAATLREQQIRELEATERELCQQLSKLEGLTEQPTEFSLGSLQLNFEKPTNTSASPGVDKSTGMDLSDRTTNAADTQPEKATQLWELPSIWESQEPEPTKIDPDCSNFFSSSPSTQHVEPCLSKPLLALPEMSLFKN